MEDSRAFLGSKANRNFIDVLNMGSKDREMELSRIITRSGMCSKMIKVSIHSDGNAKRRPCFGEVDHEFKLSWICRSGNQTRDLGWR